MLITSLLSTPMSKKIAEEKLICNQCKSRIIGVI